MVDTYCNILVVIDGLEKAEKAFLEAIAIAKRNQATLHILYVNEVTGNYFGDLALATTSLQEEPDEVVGNQMRERRNPAIERDLTDIETYVLYSYPKTLIADFHESKEPIDLVVMGAIGLNAAGRVLVGSITSYVVNHVSCNVMVIKQIKGIENKKA